MCDRIDYGAEKNISKKISDNIKIDENAGWNSL